MHNDLAYWNTCNREPFNGESVFFMYMAICRSFRDGGSGHMTTHINSVGMWVGSAGLGCVEQITAQHVWTNPSVTDGPERALLLHSCYFLSLYVLLYFPMIFSHHSASSPLMYMFNQGCNRGISSARCRLVVILSPPTRDGSQYSTSCPTTD